MTLAEIKAHMAKVGLGLQVSDFQSVVHIVHQDGSTFLFTHACHETLDKWFLVWTEHTGYHYFHTDDLKQRKMWRQ